MATITPEIGSPTTLVPLAHAVTSAPGLVQSCQQLITQVALPYHPGVHWLLLLHLQPDEGWQAWQLHAPDRWEGVAFNESLLGCDTQGTWQLLPAEVAQHLPVVATHGLALPLLMGQVQGRVLCVAAAATLADVEQAAAQLLSHVPALALRAQLDATEAERLRALRLVQVLQTVNATLDTERILETLRQALASLMRLDYVAVHLADDARQQLRPLALVGPRITGELWERYRQIVPPLTGPEAQCLLLTPLHTEQPLHLDDATPEGFTSRWDRRLHEVYPFRSAIVLPLHRGNDVTGVITLVCQSSNLRYSAALARTLQELVEPLGPALENARELQEARQAQQELMMRTISIQSQAEQIHTQHESLSRQSEAIMQQSRELESLVKIMQVINREFELEKVLAMLLDEGMLLFPEVSRSIFLVFDSPTRSFRVMAHRGFEDEDMARLSIGWKDADARYIREENQIIEGVYLLKPEQLKLKPLPGLEDVEPAQAMLALAIAIKAVVVGFIIFDNCDHPDAFNDTDRPKLRRFLEHAASAFYKAQYLRKIEQQKQDLEGANRKITDSLSYARRILEAILPRTKDIQRAFPRSFVFFRPRDIVSGDFYWFSQRHQHPVMAVVDCTGHGVPGAFMSVLGNTLLNQVVNEKGITHPGDVLKELTHQVRNMLGQLESDSQSFDGMDVVLCTYHPHERVLYFSGASRPLFLMRGPHLSIYRGMPHPVGGTQYDKHDAFETVTIPIEPGDRIYLTTDGFIDQFGGGLGPQRRKFMNSRLQHLIEELQHIPMTAQRAHFEEALDQWRGRNAQLDDVLVMGLEFE